ncbi:MAG: DUF6272 family protein [Cyanobacteriota bacterium]|nr:DUF6272 family protein [Cyanobacteriota bacterium]
MSQIFGQFRDDLPKGEEYLILRFSPSSVPLKERWSTSGLSADFMADYMATFFPGEIAAPVKSAISFIANELIENAMKYNDDRTGDSITIALYVNTHHLIFLTTNSIAPAKVGGFQEFIQELSTSDPGDLYVKRIEEPDESGQSGLGYLTMINDYQAELGWKFETIQRNNIETVAVTTMVQLLAETL